jgi:cation:H+ antiporter
MTKSLIDLDIPLLAISTVLFLGVAWDRQIVLSESLLLVAAYIIYLLYTVLHQEEESKEMTEVLPGRPDRRKHLTHPRKGLEGSSRVTFKDYIFLILGIVGLVLGAKYLIDSVVALSEILAIGAGVISLFAVALGTSLPELLVSIKAAWRGKSEIALGNIFGSNVFNILVVIGIPGLFETLALDEKTFSLGLPVLIAATFLFIISGISRRIHVWEGAMFLLVYIFFIGKLFGVL